MSRIEPPTHSRRVAAYVLAALVTIVVIAIAGAAVWVVWGLL